MTRSWRSRLFLASLIARLSEAGMSSKINTKRGVKIILIGQIYHDDKLEKVCPYNDLEFDNTFYDIFCYVNLDVSILVLLCKQLNSCCPETVTLAIF